MVSCVLSARCMPDENICVTKVELRRHLATKMHRWMLDRADPRAASEAICRNIEHHRAWQRATLVCAFLPLPSEPRIGALWEREQERRFCFPRVRGTAMELIRVDDRDRLAHADWRLAGPEFDAAPVVPADSVDLFLVPGLGFTPAGQRLGRGGGYYDRLLPQRSSTCTTLGVCFSLQLVETLPVELHDAPMDAVITERGLTPAG